MLFGLGVTRRELDAAADTLGAGEILDGNRLLHGDFGAAHVFVDESADAVTGIIDFEEGGWGDPALDLCSWHFWYPDEAPIDWLLAGYVTSPTSDRGGTNGGTSRICTSHSA